MAMEELLRRCRERVESALDARLPSVGTEPRGLHAAIRYSTLDGGKRIRAALVYLTGEALDAKPEALDVPATAVEMIHAYSLIHDDLPAMDDDDLRRGKPTCHRAFDEAAAILAGDGLQALAFEVLASDPALEVPPTRRLAMIHTLARASGLTGMVGGQALDMDAAGRRLELPQLRHMHARKTGALIGASVRLGALAAPRFDEATMGRLGEYARGLGLAFQIRDDILDVEGSTEVLGKRQGADAAHGKATYTSLLGMDEAKRLAREAADEACAALDGLDAEPLRQLAKYVVERVS